MKKEQAESAHDPMDREAILKQAKKRRMKAITFSVIGLLLLGVGLVFLLHRCSSMSRKAKPVIYLYPTETTRVSVRLNCDGKLTCTYPAYRDGWTVTAAPDGTLTDENGQTYNYLYWEGEDQTAYDLSSGFCVRGEDSAAFLTEKLELLGLNRREANEFIVYWLPRLEENPWNLITFQADRYTDSAQLEITPQPDTLIRVFMVWKPLRSPVELPAPTLSAPERTGFTVVEWGGCQLAR